jgi:uroporphyrin-III C-methyltransferase/precorrin-2 dehydrogenase/sirohydrochlorin ferrochelatase
MFPVMLCVKDRRCLVVGGGGVALRKIQSLIAEGGRVTVVAPQAAEPLELLARRGEVELQRRDYRDGEAAGYALVFAATDNRKVNRRVYEDADGAGVWANVADDPELCSFHLPARVQRGPFQLAVASAGEAPFAVRRMRQLFEHRLGPEWGEWIDAASRFRDRIRDAGLDRARQEAAFDLFFSSTVDPDRLSARVPTDGEERGWLAQAASREAVEPAFHDEELEIEHHATVAERPGLVSLVGAGPGCSGLLTVRGRQRLMEADCVVYDRLAAAAIPCDLPAACELHPVGKEAGHHPVPQEEITSLLVRLAREGKRVVRLKGGDPYVFGRGGEEAETLVADGIPFEIVPGVTSGVAAPAWIGVPVTHRAEAVRLTLLTAHESAKRHGPQVRYDLLAQDPHATLVGYMGVTSLPNVVHQLLSYGMDPETPAAMVQHGTLAAQRSVVSTVADLPDAVEREGIRPPALFVIGPTVKHAGHLDWLGRLPLAGERLVIGNARTELAAALEAAGAEVIAVPTPLSPAARIVIGASPLSGCLLGSPAEVDLMDEEREGTGWEGDPVAWCLGDESAERARERGWRRVRTIDASFDADHVVARIADSRAGRG